MNTIKLCKVHCLTGKKRKDDTGLAGVMTIWNTMLQVIVEKGISLFGLKGLKDLVFILGEPIGRKGCKPYFVQKREMGNVYYLHMLFLYFAVAHPTRIQKPVRVCYGLLWVLRGSPNIHCRPLGFGIYFRGSIPQPHLNMQPNWPGNVGGSQTIPGHI